MNEQYTTKITDSYRKIRSLYLGKSMKQLKFEDDTLPSTVTVIIDKVVDFSATGTLQSTGQLSGMSPLYKQLALTPGDEIQYGINSAREVVINSVNGTPQTTQSPTQTSSTETVMDRLNLRHVHFEAFRPENLDSWEPENETDVYLAFGVLQENTDYQYCCAASKNVLDKLGYSTEMTTKPDAILIDRYTDEYLLAEFKKNSKSFSSNHKKDDVDVLVCWFDDDHGNEELPNVVLNLEAVAEEVVKANLQRD